MQKLSDYFYRAIRAASVGALAVALVAGLSLAPAQAQYGNYGYRNISRADVQRLALVNGYADGYEHGIMDRRYRRAPNYRDAGEYRRGLNGYDSRWGNARDYQNWYRQSYSRGYMDGFNGRTRNRDYDRGRYPGYGGYPGYGAYPGYGNYRGELSSQEVARRAAQNGYNAGFQRGQWDAQQRARANPRGHGAYQYGLDGWVREWGSASTYQQYYRQYFVQGYNDGFNRRSFDRRYYRSF